MNLKFLSVLALVGLCGCAHLPAGKGEDPHVLLADACDLGQANRAVSGSVWMKLDSKEARGQFPASVSAKAPDSVILEVTNLIGSREALIRVSHGKYLVQTPKNEGHPAAQREGEGSWGGIPLRWASDLFLGRIPCPVASEITELRVTPDGDLIARTSQARFEYRFHEWAGKPWPEALHWELLGRPQSAVDFKFRQPAEKSGSPKNWDARSSRGEVKLRWRDMQITR